MTEVLFYHLERARLDVALAELLQKTLAKGWRALVRIGGPEALEMLDEALWTSSEESFLPHQAAPKPVEGEVSTQFDADLAARQPIWLTCGDEVPNDANVLFLVARAVAGLDALPDFERVVLMFDDADEEAKGAARQFWKAVGDDDRFAATYWRQNASGRWEKQG